MTEASYQMLEVLLFCDRERVLNTFHKEKTMLTFLLKKKESKMKFIGVSIFWEYTKKTLSNLDLVVVLESKGLYFSLNSDGSGLNFLACS